MSAPAPTETEPPRAEGTGAESSARTDDSSVSEQAPDESTEGPDAAVLARAQDLREQGRRALDQRRFKRAVARLEESTALVTDDLEAFYLLGRAYWGEDRPYRISPEKAMRAFERAIELDPDQRSSVSLEAHRALALTYVRNERMPEARAAYQALLDRDPDRGRHDGYRAQIDEVDLDLGVYQPGPDAVFNDKGEFLAPIGPTGMRTNQQFEKGRHTQDPVKAEIYYKAALETDPILYQAYNNVGMALLNQGHYRDAIPYFEEADRVFRLARESTGHGYTRAQTWLIRCYVELGELEKAAEHWQIVQALPNRDNWTALWGLRLAIAAGESAVALPMLEAAAAEDPEHVEIQHALALAYADLERYDEAAARMAQAIDAIPDGHAHFHHLLEPYRAKLTDWTNKARAQAESDSNGRH